jgi:hypothetical protein
LLARRAMTTARTCKRSPFSVAASTAALLLLASCAGASAVRFGSAVHEPRPAGEPVEVFDSLDDVGRPYEKVGRVVGEGDDGVAFARIVDCMRDEARRLGADAIVLQGGSLLRGGDAECCSTDRTVHALAVRWR